MAVPFTGHKLTLFGRFAVSVTADLPNGEISSRPSRSAANARKGGRTSRRNLHFGILTIDPFRGIWKN